MKPSSATQINAISPGARTPGIGLLRIACATEKTVVLPPITRAMSTMAVALTAGDLVRMREPNLKSCASCSSAVDTQTPRVDSLASVTLPNDRRAARAASSALNPPAVPSRVSSLK
jgi:hypothetical protein